MSRNGSGTHSLPAGNPVVTGTTISSTVMNNTLSDISNALTESLAKDGQTTPTANLPMGGYAHTGVGDATARTQYAKVSQVQDGGYVALSSVSGTDTITATCAPAITAYAAGQSFKFTAAGANTGAVTLNINSLGAKAVTKEGTTALAAGDIASGAVVWVDYDGTRFQLTSGRSVQPLDDQLTTLAGMTAQQATDLAALSTFMGTVLNDADAATARTTLGAQDTLVSGTNIKTVNGSSLLGSGDVNLGAQSLASSGYKVLPGGLIIQWGIVNFAANTTVTLPIAFPTAHLAVYGNGYTSSANPIFTGSQRTLTTFIAVSSSATAYDFHWLAIGY